jgi:hypothetical protein
MTSAPGGVAPCEVGLYLAYSVDNSGQRIDVLVVSWPTAPTRR